MPPNLPKRLHFVMFAKSTRSVYFWHTRLDRPACNIAGMKLPYLFCIIKQNKSSNIVFVFRLIHWFQSFIFLSPSFIFAQVTTVTISYCRCNIIKCVSRTRNPFTQMTSLYPPRTRANIHCHEISITCSLKAQYRWRVQCHRFCLKFMCNGQSRNLV